MTIASAGNQKESSARERGQTKTKTTPQPKRKETKEPSTPAPDETVIVGPMQFRSEIKIFRLWAHLLARQAEVCARCRFPLLGREIDTRFHVSSEEKAKPGGYGSRLP